MYEHDPVYTFGLRERDDYHLKYEKLKTLGAEVFKVIVCQDIVM